MNEVDLERMVVLRLRGSHDRVDDREQGVVQRRRSDDLDFLLQLGEGLLANDDLRILILLRIGRARRGHPRQKCDSATGQGQHASSL